MLTVLKSAPWRIKHVLLMCVATLLAALLLPVTAMAVATHVLITLPAGATAPAEFAGQLAAWRFSGEASSVLLLDENQKAHPEFKGPPGFSSLALLEFPSESYYEAWKKNSQPKIKPPLVVTRADALIHGEITPRDSNKSIFVVNVYDPLVSADAYKKYVDDYIAPNMANQRATKTLIRYTMYLERDVAKPKSVLVMEYRDNLAYARSEGIKDEFKKKMASNATWKKINDTKDTIRADGPQTGAVYVEPPPPELPGLPAYKPEMKVVGGLRIIGSELKNAVDYLAEGFMKFHPEAKVTTSHLPSSEGGIAGLYMGVSDVAPMGDDAKITDVMPFYNTFGYMPTEISVATGGYEKRGSLWAWAVVVSKDNPLNEISLDELDRVFGSERSGGWILQDNNYLFTSKFARGPETNIRKWGQLGLKGEFANKEIETFGYSAPGFATSIERNWFHWSKKYNPNFKEYVEVKQATPDAAGAAVASERPLEELSKNKYMIGIAGMMHVRDYPDVKVLKISRKKGEPAVALMPENVVNRSYPLIRDAYFYVNKPPKGMGYIDPKVREFMRFVLSREGQEIIARVGYYYPIDAAYLTEQLKKLD